MRTSRGIQEKRNESRVKSSLLYLCLNRKREESRSEHHKTFTANSRISPISNATLDLLSSLKMSTPDVGETIACLLCARCKFPLVTKSDIIADRATVWASTVYSYELDVLGEEIWVYSATNPSANRFDVFRCGAGVNANAVVYEDRFSGEHSWFPGYEWSMASCGLCGVHLGWAFSQVEAAAHEASEVEGGRSSPSSAVPEASHRSAENDSDNSSEGEEEEEEEELEEDVEEQDPTSLEGSKRAVHFFGLIVTKCVADEQYDLGRYELEIDEAPQRRQAFVERSTMVRRLFRLLNQLRDRVSANRIAMYVNQLETNGQLSTAVLEELVTVANGTVLSQLAAEGPTQIDGGTRTQPTTRPREEPDNGDREDRE